MKEPLKSLQTLCIDVELNLLEKIDDKEIVS